MFSFLKNSSNLSSSIEKEIQEKKELICQSNLALLEIQSSIKLNQDKIAYLESYLKQINEEQLAQRTLEVAEVVSQ